MIFRPVHTVLYNYSVNCLSYTVQITFFLKLSRSDKAVISACCHDHWWWEEMTLFVEYPVVVSVWIYKPGRANLQPVSFSHPGYRNPTDLLFYLIHSDFHREEEMLRSRIRRSHLAWLQNFTLVLLLCLFVFLEKQGFHPASGPGALISVHSSLHINVESVGSSTRFWYLMRSGFFL